ncbi:hypothetical protein ARMGADRAFT_1085419 [Armillaria gallica]|uniref:Uncharacterized protein n=1 Tax=Armillaria gallica TaxID=47427 RepID=A0A2H3DF71_ARMGA|nr:hypothetical protein ARMGADRAFT_1085419 [Armillaria gallica]
MGIPCVMDGTRSVRRDEEEFFNSSSSVMMGEKDKPGTVPKIPQTSQMLQPDSGFRFSLDGSSLLPTTGSSWTTPVP